MKAKTIQTNTPPVPRAVVNFYNAKNDPQRREAAMNLLNVLQEERSAVTPDCDEVLKWLRRDQRRLLYMLANGARYIVQANSEDGYGQEQLAVFQDQDDAEAFAEEKRPAVHSDELLEIVDAKTSKVLKTIEASEKQRMFEQAEAV